MSRSPRGATRIPSRVHSTGAGAEPPKLAVKLSEAPASRVAGRGPIVIVGGIVRGSGDLHLPSAFSMATSPVVALCGTITSSQPAVPAIGRARAPPAKVTAFLSGSSPSIPSRGDGSFSPGRTASGESPVMSKDRGCRIEQDRQATGRTPVPAGIADREAQLRRLRVRPESRRTPGGSGIRRFHRRRTPRGGHRRSVGPAIVVSILSASASGSTQSRAMYDLEALARPGRRERRPRQSTDLEDCRRPPRGAVGGPNPQGGSESAVEVADTNAKGNCRWAPRRGSRGR